jgi:DNA-binding response OmpR family regulator
VTIALDEDRQAVMIGKTGVRLSRSEWAIVWTAFEANGKLVVYDRLYSAIWGMADLQPDETRSTLSVMVWRVRHKLRRHGAGDLIETIWGRGLRFNTELAMRP